MNDRVRVARHRPQPVRERLVAVEADERTNIAIVTCAIDNLGKGAAGQAIQNANLGSVKLGTPGTALITVSGAASKVTVGKK